MHTGEKPHKCDVCDYLPAAPPGGGRRAAGGGEQPEGADQATQAWPDLLFGRRRGGRQAATHGTPVWLLTSVHKLVHM